MRIIRYLLFTALLCPLLTFAQDTGVTLSGIIREAKGQVTMPFVNVVLKTQTDNRFIAGTVTTEEGRFVLKGITSGNYRLEVSYVGYIQHKQELLAGTLTPFLDLGTIHLKEDPKILNEVKITSVRADGLAAQMDKRIFTPSDNISRAGGSVLQAMQNLPGVTMQDGKIMLRGNDKVAVLIDGRQNAITGFGSQTALDNIPASAIERIEIINNPTAKYDANGNAGIINIIYKKNNQDGFNGKIGLSTGLGALWVRKENLPGIRPQYQATPKINPSLSLNYRKNKLNAFLQTDWLYNQTLNRNEFAERIYDDGSVIKQQVKRNRTTTVATAKTGIDWNPDEQNTFTLSGLFSREKIADLGDIPYFNQDLSIRSRLWSFVEDEVKYTATASAIYQHKFKQPGHVLNSSFNYTFHREDEKYFFNNITPAFTGTDSYKLLSDEQVADLNVDYIKPLKQGRLETGLKLRHRYIPTNMEFFPGANSVIDPNSGGWANYKETIPAVYGNYIYENRSIEVEAGIRVEYVNVKYEVNPDHNTYQSDGYHYARPFPNVRFSWKPDDRNKFSLFYNGRVDRPNEVDIRIFPKYDEPEVLKVGNPSLRPQFTNTFELGYKTSWTGGSLYTAAYHKTTDATITRIATIVPGSTLIYNIFQNAGRSYNYGLEMNFDQKATPWFSFNVNAALYRNTLNAFTIENRYPVPTVFTAARQSLTSGNLKLNGRFKLPAQTEIQFSTIYLAPDLIPQGRIASRFSADLGIRKHIQKGKGEIFMNGTDILNTLRIKRSVTGNGFILNSTDYYETQVFRIGYSYKF